MAFSLKKDSSNTDDKTRMNRTLGFLGWIQEFTKKVVTVTFIVFLLSNLYFLIMVWMEYRSSLEIMYLDTFITETHQTFREVIGGYLVKAAAENVIKIGGGYMESYLSTKTTIIEQQKMMVAGGGNIDIGEPVNENPTDDSEDPENPHVMEEEEDNGEVKG